MRYSMILVIRGDRRLCNDDKWRKFANFGSESSCVKVYRRTHNAIHKRNYINAIVNHKRDLGLVGDLTLAQVVVLPPNHTINAVGNVTEEVDGVHRGERNIEDFIIDKVT